MALNLSSIVVPAGHAGPWYTAGCRWLLSGVETRVFRDESATLMVALFPLCSCFFSLFSFLSSECSVVLYVTSAVGSRVFLMAVAWSA